MPRKNYTSVRLFEIWIYNRWGEEVYHSNDMDAAWMDDVDGGTHFAPNGVYHWVIKVAGFDTDAQEFRGLHLMRQHLTTFLMTNSISGCSLRGAFVAVTLPVFHGLHHRPCGCLGALA